MDGELALWCPTGGPPSRLYLAAQGHLWAVSLDREHGLQWVQQAPLEHAERQLPTAWSPGDGLLPVADVPAGLAARLQAAAVRVEELRVRYDAGEAWIPQGSAFVGTHPLLGSLRVSPDSGRISSRPHPFHELFAWVWAHAEGFPGPLPGEARAGVAAILDPIAALLTDARRDGSAIALDPAARQLLFPYGGRIFWLSDLDAAGVERLLFNPHAAALPLAKVVDRLSYGGPFTLIAVPAALQAALPRLDEELRRTRRAIVDRYIAMLRGGGTISGGPTTDQSWTVRHTDGGFVIEGYSPTEDGLERTCDPIAEDRVRTMIGTYAMFGLGELADEA